MARPSLLLLAASLAFLLPAAPRLATAAQPLGSHGLDALALSSAIELGLEPEPSAEFELELESDPEPPTCVDPEPRSRWTGRHSDDDWIPGLYPARERYADDTLALTFDDGPHRSRTPIALAELARRDMHATFFLTGHAIRKNSYALVQQMVREGHTLANHGWRHDTRMASESTTVAELEAYVSSEFELTQIRVDFAMLAESAEDFAAMDREVFAGLSFAKHDREFQLAKMPYIRARHRVLLESRGYSEDHRPVTLEWVRPPGGNPYLGSRWSPEERDAFARAVNATGMRMVMWSGGSGDSDTNLTPAERRDPERVAAAARKAARRGGVFVAHDRIDSDALRAMLDAVEASEVEVVSLAQLRAYKLGCE